MKVYQELDLQPSIDEGGCYEERYLRTQDATPHSLRLAPRVRVRLWNKGLGLGLGLSRGVNHAYPYYQSILQTLPLSLLQQGAPCRCRLQTPTSINTYVTMLYYIVDG